MEKITDRTQNFEEQMNLHDYIYALILEYSINL